MRHLMALVLATGLMGCQFAAPQVVEPDVPEIVGPEPPAGPVVVPPSQASRDLSTYYRRLQNDLLNQGLLRGDGGGPDTPFTDTLLARNFVRIALFNEYRDDSDFQRPQATVSKLRRWTRPIRMSVEFGETVPLEQRDLDLAGVSAYAARLSRLTGVPIVITDRNPNFRVLFLGEDDRRAYGPRLREIIPNISDATVRTFVNLPRDQLCVVIGTFAPGQSSYTKAVAMIRAEHPNLMRSACIHEELAQAVVQHAFTLDHGPFFGIVRGCIVLKILNQSTWLGTFVQDLRLAFVNLLAACHDCPLPDTLGPAWTAS